MELSLRHLRGRSKCPTNYHLYRFSSRIDRIDLWLAGCSKTNTPDASAQNQPAQTDQQGAATDNLAPDRRDPGDRCQYSAATGKSAPRRPISSLRRCSRLLQLRRCSQAAQNQNASNDESNAEYQDTSYGQPVLQAQQPPPPLPEYSQPPIPGDGYLWTPGYWSYAPQGYFWVPGAWAMPPQVGFLWTPGYWGFSAGIYRFNYGFWGPYVGFYGGINYGFGYGGIGYQGGYWSGNRFNYNRSVNNVNITNVNVYNRNVTNSNDEPRQLQRTGRHHSPTTAGGKRRVASAAHSSHVHADRAPAGGSTEPPAVCLRQSWASG